MSRLDQLLAELCPDGVPYEKLSDISVVVRGVTYSKGSEISSADGYKILRANNISLSTNTINYDDVKYISDIVKVNPDQKLRKQDILICTASGSREHIGKVAFVHDNLDYYFGGFMAVIRTKSIMISRFLYHLLLGRSFSTHLENTLNTSTINNLNSTILGSFIIPIPPLPIQEEIVRILDTFTALEAELEEKLNAELEARTKQYETYRDTLLNFELENIQTSSRPTRLNRLIQTLCPEGVNYRILGSICNITTGKLNANAMKENGIYPFFTCAKEIFKIDKYAFDTEALLVSGNGSQVGHIHHYKGKFNAYQRTYVLDKFSENIKFVEYLLRAYLKKRIVDEMNVSGVPYIRLEALSDFLIPIPPLPVQEEIVAILDRFDALVNDLKNGLPAEIAARRKQYEYYRDQLLTFTPLP